MAFRDREMLADLFESYRCGCLQPFGPQAYLAQLRGNRHGKATGISNNVGPVNPFLSALLRSLQRVVFVVISRPLHRRPRLARNLSVGFSPTYTSLRSLLGP